MHTTTGGGFHCFSHIALSRALIVTLSMWGIKDRKLFLKCMKITKKNHHRSVHTLASLKRKVVLLLLKSAAYMYMRIEWVVDIVFCYKIHPSKISNKCNVVALMFVCHHQQLNWLTCVLFNFFLFCSLLSLLSLLCFVFCVTFGWASIEKIAKGAGVYIYITRIISYICHFLMVTWETLKNK